MVGIKLFLVVSISYAAFLIAATAGHPPALHLQDGIEVEVPLNNGSDFRDLGGVNGKGFFLEANLTMNWTTAKTYCREAGLALASIDTKDEWDFLNVTLVPYGIGYRFWTSAAESRRPSMFLWDGTANHPDASLFPHWWWMADPQLCVLGAIIGSGFEGDHLDAEVHFCTEEHRVLCQKLL